jgi:protease-4
MSIDPDVILDRRRLKRKLGFWRVLAFLALVVAVFAGVAASGAFRGLGGPAGAHIARISITGVITPDRKLVELIDRVGRSSSVKGVVVAINSPGGVTSGGEMLYEALRKLSAKKPTVAQVDSLAASAGYMAALGADRIVARRSALTGSIGVLAQWGDVSELMAKVGVKLEEVKSTPLKAEPNPFKPTSPEARAMLDRVIQDTYAWFVGMVAERRGMSFDEAKALADGRVVTGQQAVALKLVDEVGGQDVAIAWLEREKGVQKNLRVRDWRPSSEWSFGERASESIARGVLAALGIDQLVEGRLQLDGLRSVWHPSHSEN